MRIIAKLGAAFRFLNENGAYLFAMQMASYPGSKLRDRMFGAKFGVGRIHIGPRSFVRGLSAMKIGEDFTAGEGLWLESILQYRDQKFAPQIIIGNNVSVSHWSTITATNYVEIGDNVLIASKVLITDHNHGAYNGGGNSPTVPPKLRPLDAARRTIIEKNVWLGDGVVVTAGSKVGESSVIGANSVVCGEIPPYTIAAGSPAKAIKRYDCEIGQWIRSK